MEKGEGSYIRNVDMIITIIAAPTACHRDAAIRDTCLHSTTHESFNTSSVTFCESSVELLFLLLREKVDRIFSTGQRSTSMRCCSRCFPSLSVKPLPCGATEQIDSQTQADVRPQRRQDHKHRTPTRPSDTNILPLLTKLSVPGRAQAICPPAWLP
jgi:hypothetical protein